MYEPSSNFVISFINEFFKVDILLYLIFICILEWYWEY